MKSPSRMRKLYNLTNMDSSAIEVQPIPSNNVERSQVSSSSKYLVSARYSRRTVKFQVPEIDRFSIKDFKDTKLPNGLNANEIFENQENNGTISGSYFDAGTRRMSAPELPPIGTTGKPVLVNNGLVTPRSNTFLLNKTRHRHSIHSDSSIKGYGLNCHSRASSSSSQKSRGRVLSAGTYRETLTADFTKNIQQKSEPKLETPTMRYGMALSVSQRSITNGVAGVGRQPTKLSLKDSQSTPRTTIPQSRSEAILTPRTRNLSEPYGGMRRNNSDKSLSENKQNSKNNKFTTQKHKNGIRKNLSANGFCIKDDRRSDDNVLDKDVEGDSDSDNNNHQRVMDWIIGVKDAEPPQEPEIEHLDEPPQRDTAIRIVYEGDS